MIRLPDWAYARVEKIYFSQRSTRRREDSERLADEDRRLREWADQKSIDHDMGLCGGVANGCPFVPCVPRLTP